jgi:hypothetical protein
VRLHRAIESWVLQEVGPARFPRARDAG